MMEYEAEQYGTVFGVPANDYLTVTTFNAQAFQTVKQHVMGKEEQKDYFTRYRGVRVGQLRFLEGMQSNREHYMIIAEGSASEWLLRLLANVYHPVRPELLYSSFKATRIDCQVSVRDDTTVFRDLKDEIGDKDNQWRRRGRKPLVQLVEGQKNKRGLGSTLYIGSKKVKDGYFVRMYEKPDDEDNRWLRFEIQFKGKSADKAFFDIVSNHDYNPDRFIRQIMDTFPERLISGLLSELYSALDSTEGFSLAAKRIRSDDTRRALWFKYHIMPTICKIESEKACVLMERQLIRALLIIKNNRVREERWDRIKMLEEAGEIEEAERLAALQVNDDIGIQMLHDECHPDDDIEHHIEYHQPLLWEDEALEYIYRGHYTDGI
jgi:hypothetical protein